MNARPFQSETLPAWSGGAAGGGRRPGRSGTAGPPRGTRGRPCAPRRRPREFWASVPRACGSPGERVPESTPRPAPAPGARARGARAAAPPPHEQEVGAGRAGQGQGNREEQQLPHPEEKGKEGEEHEGRGEGERRHHQETRHEDGREAPAARHGGVGVASGVGHGGRVEDREEVVGGRAHEHGDDCGGQDGKEVRPEPGRRPRWPGRPGSEAAGSWPRGSCPGGPRNGPPGRRKGGPGRGARWRTRFRRARPGPRRRRETPGRRERVAPPHPSRAGAGRSGLKTLVSSMALSRGSRQ